MRRFVHLLRSLIFLSWQTITVIPWAVMVLIASIWIRGEPLYRLCVGWIRVVLWGARVFCGIHTRIHGWENLPTSAAVLCSKHQSAWETLAFPAIMPRPLSFIFKRELLWVPFFGWALGRLDMVHIDRRKTLEAWSRVAEQGAEYMAQGNWVIMFPEGTRIARGKKGNYKAGAARLAITTGVPLVPIAVTSARCWPKQAFIKTPGVIEVSIGPAINTQGRQPEELMREAEAWIEAEMQRVDAEAYPSSSPNNDAPS